jgi:hypothetical protein
MKSIVFITKNISDAQDIKKAIKTELKIEVCAETIRDIAESQCFEARITTPAGITDFDEKRILALASKWSIPARIEDR